jgi:diketogulonate reductase-like aldo/keto reductase
MNGNASTSTILNKPFLYGTAWKEDRTKQLTRLAIEQGFRGIDTANQRKHYCEVAVGDAIKESFRDGIVAREELFVQTKYTFQSGQDHRLPYNPTASIAEQVKQSFASSLEHLGVDYLDSYVLHGPSRGVGLHANDWDAWRSMEQLHDSAQVRSLGISNVSQEQLELLLAKARIKPAFVQNRCYASQGWGRDVREFCREHGIVYQAFSLLTANAKVLSNSTLVGIAAKHQRDVTQIVFRFAVDVGMLPLTGTSQAKHMRSDLEVLDFHLSPDEVRDIENIAWTNR